jgi:hypothetical protein
VNRQSGISTAAIALVLVLLGTAAGGFFGWQQHQELRRTQFDLASARAAADKASADARAAKADAATARKEFEEQKAALQQARSEADTAKVFLESEKATAVRLQADLKLAREQIAYMRTRGSPYAVPEQQPMVVRPAPSRIEAIQVQRSAPQAVGVNPAQPQPGVGYGTARPQPAR